MSRLSILKLGSSALKPLLFQFTFFSLFFTLCSLVCLTAQAQIKYEVEAHAIGTPDGSVPFWMRSNQYGSIPMAGTSTSFLGRARKEYDSKQDSTERKKLLDWGIGIEARMNTNFRSTKFILTEGYLKGRLGIFELRAGRSKETMGLTGDSTLSSGSFPISGNALGVPKITLLIPDYYRLPLLKGLFSIKGTFAHGWVGDISLRESPGRTILHVPTYFHQKSLYGKIGNKGRLSLTGGFSHQVFWGNEASFNPAAFNLNTFQTYTYVLAGRVYGTEEIPRSKIGNHLGSIDIGFNYEFERHRLFVYRQNLYDVGALFRLANLRDGLNGLTLKNKKPSSEGFAWNEILFEFLTTANQAGELWSKRTNSGDEDYYNNYLYANGWSYKNLGLGTPFITKREDLKKGQAIELIDYFSNNRLFAGHLGLKYRLHRWHYTTKISYSYNMGTYATTVGRSRGSSRDPAPTPEDRFKPAKQLSVYLAGNRYLNKNVRVGYALSSDSGELINNGWGMSLWFVKDF